VSGAREGSLFGEGANSVQDPRSSGAKVMIRTCQQLTISRSRPRSTGRRLAGSFLAPFRGGARNGPSM
jgi:hypothetical protein